MTQKTRYTLILEPVAQGPWRTPPLLRLKALLKAALRGYGLRCTSATEHPAPATPDAPPLASADAATLRGMSDKMSDKE